MQLREYCGLRNSYDEVNLSVQTFDEDSDVAQLEKLQEKLLDLEEKNFSKTKDWILNSIFTQSEEGMHDLIYTFYLISSARVNDNKSLIFSRMITSLYELKLSNKYLDQIPTQAIELLAITRDMDIKEIVQNLISNSIIKQSQVDLANSRKIYGFDENMRFYNGKSLFLYNKLLYPRFSNEKIEVLRVIHEDNLEFLSSIIADGVDVNEKHILTFNSWKIEFSLIDYAALNGSINCFKYLLVNGAELSKCTAEFSFIGGNIEIIRILDQRKFIFSTCLINSSACFYNDIFDWLVDRPYIDLSVLNTTENVHALRYLLERQEKVRMSILNSQSIILTNFFLQNFNDDAIKNVALKNACMTGNVGLVKYLCEKYPLKINYSSLIQISFQENQIEIVKYLKNRNIEIKI